jgi:hypothetical protein
LLLGKKLIWSIYLIFVLVQPPQPPGLSPQQQDRLTELEQTIEGGLQSFITVGAALLAVRDEQLFLPHYASFTEYCRERWGFGLRHSRRLIGAFKICENLSSAESEGDYPLPNSEMVVRCLAAFEPPLQVAIWKLASKVNPQPNSKIVGRIVTVVRRAIEQGRAGANGAGQTPQQARIETSRNSTKFLLSLHQLADNRCSPYLVVEQLNEVAAQRLLTSCQRLIVLAHDCIETIRSRYPTM